MPHRSLKEETSYSLDPLQNNRGFFKKFIVDYCDHNALNLCYFIAPSLFLILAVFETLYRPQFGSASKITFNFFAETVLFNSTHVGITLFLLTSNPYFKDYVFETKKIHGVNLWYKWGLGFLFALSIYLILFLSPPGVFGEVPMHLLLTIGLLIYGAHHNISQGVGFSLLDYSNSDRTNEKLKRVIKFEKISKYILLFVAAIGIVVRAIVPGDYHFYFVTGLVVFSVLLLSYHIVILHAWDPQSLPKKVFYLPRYLLIALTLNSIFANLGLAAAHSIEYLIIMYKFNDTLNIKATLRGATKVCILVICIHAILSITNAHSGLLAFFTNDSSPSFLWYHLAASAFYALNFTHTYVDSFIFKFSDPAVKKTIAIGLFKNTLRYRH